MTQVQDAILIIDFGSQYTRLIARRLREGGFYSYILSCNNHEGINKFAGKGIVLAGSNRSVNAKDAEFAKGLIESKKVPILGICYGMHLLAEIYSGKVKKGKGGEYGYGQITLKDPSNLLPTTIKDVWFSHGDEVVAMPDNFSLTSMSGDGVITSFENDAKGLYAVQFHPEVAHTVNGSEILWKFAKLCGCADDWQTGNIINSLIEDMGAKIKPNDRVLIALSGGVDSTVMAVLAQKVFGKNILPIFVDNGLLRKNEGAEVVIALNKLGIDVIKVDAGEQFLSQLAGVTDPEQKRKIIGKLFIDIFEATCKEQGEAQWLAQGTIYPDVIESSGDANSAAEVIKSHHNVGGLPDDLAFDLWEPLRMLFKDEVRKVGAELGLPREFLERHPFPGPGLAVRVLGEVKEEYLQLLREADAIFIDELRKANLYNEVSQAFCVFLPIRSVGVMGDARSYGYVVALRAVVTDDFMTAKSAPLSPEFLAKVAGRITNQVEQITRVVFDYSSKPPATIEWE